MRTRTGGNPVPSGVEGGVAVCSATAGGEGNVVEGWSGVGSSEAVHIRRGAAVGVGGRVMIGGGDGQAVRARAVSSFCTSRSAVAISSRECVIGWAHAPRILDSSTITLTEMNNSRSTRNLGLGITSFASIWLAFA